LFFSPLLRLLLASTFCGNDQKPKAEPQEKQEK
jgi:hypothetical protein